MSINKKMIILGISIIVCAAAFIGFTQYDLIKFRKDLSSQIPDEVDIDEVSIVPKISKTDQNINSVNNSEIEVVPVETEEPTDTTSTEKTDTKEDVTVTSEVTDENKLTDGEIDGIIDQAFAFTNPDVDGMKQQLLDALLARYGADERVFRLTDLWEASHHIIKKVTEFNEASQSSGSVRHEEATELMDMLPGYIFKEAGEVAISLFGHGEAKAAEIRQDASNIEEAFNKMDMGLIAGPMVQEAYHNGEITLEEAKVFFKATTGLELKIVTEE